MNNRPGSLDLRGKKIQNRKGGYDAGRERGITMQATDGQETKDSPAPPLRLPVKKDEK